MTNSDERICKYCGTTNYGVIHHCLKCGGELPDFFNQADTLVEFGDIKTPAPGLIPRPAPTPDYLEVTSELDRGFTYELEDGVCFGRSGSCDIVIDSPKVSRNHAKIVQSQNYRWMLIDLESTNGTMLNDMRISGPVNINHGDKIQVGNFEFKVVINSMPPLPNPPDTLQLPWEEENISFSEPLPEKKTKGRKFWLLLASAGFMLICACALFYLGSDYISRFLAR